MSRQSMIQFVGKYIKDIRLLNLPFYSKCVKT
jgi:hypothetical protein